MAARKRNRKRKSERTHLDIEEHLRDDAIGACVALLLEIVELLREVGVAAHELLGPVAGRETEQAGGWRLVVSAQWERGTVREDTVILIMTIIIINHKKSKLTIKSAYPTVTRRFSSEGVSGRPRSATGLITSGWPSG